MESVSEGYWASSESNNKKSFAYVDNSFNAFTFKAHSCKQDRKNKAALQQRKGGFKLQQQQSEGVKKTIQLTYASSWRLWGHPVRSVETFKASLTVHPSSVVL